MNIVYVVFSFNVGGIEKLLIDVLNNICTKEDNIYLYIINNNYDFKLLSEISDKVNIICVNREPKDKKIKYMIDFAKFVKKEKVDVIHCQCINSIKFSLLAKLLKIRLKLIHTVHDTRIYYNIRKKDIYIEKIFVSDIIAISESVKKEIIQKKINQNKIEVIYNSIDLNKFNKCRQLKDDRLKDKDEFIVGNIARLVPEKKGQDVLIKAIGILKNKYPNIKCLLVGGEVGEKKVNLEKLKNLAISNGVADNIHFLGKIQDVTPILAKLDVFVLPSIYEGFGISLIEAMAAGLPCIASNIDGPQEIIQKYGGGILFESGNHEDLAEKIEYMLNRNNDCYNVMDKLDDFKIDMMIDKLIQVYSRK